MALYPLGEGCKLGSGFVKKKELQLIRGIINIVAVANIPWHTLFQMYLEHQRCLAER